MAAPAKTIRSNPAWGGSPPANADEARQRLAEIAITVFEQKGMRKAFLAEVARQAGISRPTLYSYYPTKESLIFGAMGIEVQAWMRRLLRHVAGFNTPQERLIEGMVYAILHLGETRVLKFIADPEYVQLVGKGDPGFELSLEGNAQSLEPVFELAPELRERRREIAELVYRLITSFLQYPIGGERSEDELREYIQGFLLPAVGLPPLK